MTLISSNLLNRALKILPSQQVMYLQAIGRYNNDIGLYETNYSNNPQLINGSVQAVPQNSYQELGLDFGKNYINFFTNTPLIGVERDVSGDKLIYDSKVYQCQSSTNWKAMNGWISILSVQIEVAPDDPINVLITPNDDYVVTPDGRYIKIITGQNSDNVVTPDGNLVITPEDNNVVVPDNL